MNIEQMRDQLASLIRSQVGTGPLQAGEHCVHFRSGQAAFTLPAVARRAPVAPRPQGEQADTEARASGAIRVAGQGDGYVIEGVTSSTSVDWYGTEMSPRALDDMADQFRAGVDLFPRHGGWSNPVEWNEVLGRTFAAEVERADVANPADESEPGFVLTIRANVDPKAPGAAELERRLDSGQPIGLSIGGWFLEVRYVVDDDGEIQRIIIDRVELDHTAVVRAPANPDSIGLKLLRSAMQARGNTTQPPAVSAAHEPTNQDHGVTPARSIDNSAPAGNDAGEATNTDPASPESRSITMDEMKAILDKLGEIQRTQEQTAAKLAELEGRVNERTVGAPSQEAAAAPTPEASEQRSAALDPEAIARAIAEATAKAIAERTQAATPAPDADADAEMRARVARLEAERDRQDALIADLMGSGRVGRGRGGATESVADLGYHTERSKDKLTNLIARAKESGQSNVLCAVVSRNVDSIAIAREVNGLPPRGERGKQFRQAAENAPFVLHSILAAAEADGLIGDFDTGWSV